MNNNDISMNTSINIIYNELLKMYNNFNFNNSKTIEPFSLQLNINNNRDNFIETVIRAKNYGYEINFTIDELESVLNNLELRANLLTFEQQEQRKKIIINLKDILLSEKLKDIKNNFIQNILDNNYSLPDQEIINKQNIKENINGYHTLLLNVLNLFIEDIENISKNIKELTIKEVLTKKNEDLTKKNEDLTKKNEELNIKINITNIITIILVILLVIVILFYFFKK